uniref:3'(2'),5'-bisphosphate nucleotidase 1 n=1 Tax=Glossina brevipalpis TaxID=37001 RepID=A0A1A9W5P8_9MUSC
MAEPLIMRVMALSFNTVKRAGAIIREVMQRGDLNIVEKGKDDLQTEADRSAQRCIIASLNKEFPKVQIIGEEGLIEQSIPEEWLVTEIDAEFIKFKCPKEWNDVKEEDMVIWVDPLDGTSEYAHGLLEHVTVLVGIAVKDSAVGGIIHQPYYKQTNGEMGRTIWGLKGLGTGGFKSSLPPSDKFIITTTRSHSNAIIQASIDALSPTEVIRVGGAGFKVLHLLEGKAHAYVFASAGTKKWDTCAPEAVLEAEGGILTDLKGQHYSYSKDVDHVNVNGILASMSHMCHDNIVKKLPSHIFENMQKI